MVLRLAATMDLPLRQQNALMLAAGYAPAWGERDLSAPDLAVVNRALDYMLAQHEPFPAFVVDRRWNLLRANRGAVKLIEFLTGPSPAEPASGPVNLAIALVSSDGLRPSSPTGRRSHCISYAAYKPTPMPMAPRRRWRC